MNNYSFNAVLDLMALLAIGCICSTEFLKKRKMSNIKKNLWGIYKGLVATTALILIVDMGSWLFDGKTFAGTGTLLLVTNSVYDILQIVYCYLWLIFADYWTIRADALKGDRIIWYAIPLILEILVVFMNTKTGWVFTITSDNVYQRGDFYLLNLLPFYIYVLGALAVGVYGIVSKNEEKKTKNISILILMVLPVCGTMLQSFYYGMSLIWPTVSLSLVLVYVNIQRQALAEEYINNERLEQNARVEIMLSEIQPHFLYNSLTTIYCLCEIDPLKAQEAVSMFSDYLRYNMESLKYNYMITFADELDHVKVYITLEELRFENMLQTNWDIQTEDFMIPSLTLQPLVENAVKHGVGKSVNGGSVTISAYEEECFYTIDVIDDGIGFEQDDPKAEGHTHIGIENVRGRLAANCGGLLFISSQKGVGTKATIKIPKEPK